MKFYLNRKPIIGPWGGGNRFITELVTQLSLMNHEIFYDLTINADVYVCFDPRPNDTGVTFDDIKSHATVMNGRLVCRVGDIGTHGKPSLPFAWAKAVIVADNIIFPSSWAYDKLLFYVDDHQKLQLEQRTSIIHNGAAKLFVNAYKQATVACGSIDVITHHWSDNSMKGFDIYSAIDNFDNINFTYIGRTPDYVTFKNYISPCDVDGLVKYLKFADVYLTASKFEAGANHVLEAMALGLPVVYSKYGGSIVEYCNGRGVEYDGTAHGALNAIHTCVESKITYPRYTRTVSDAVSEFIGVITR